MKDKDSEIADTMKCFIDQFGEIDLYAQIVLEEFIKKIIEK